MRKRWPKRQGTEEPPRSATTTTALTTAGRSCSWRSTSYASCSVSALTRFGGHLCSPPPPVDSNPARFNTQKQVVRHFPVAHRQQQEPAPCNKAIIKCLSLLERFACYLWPQDNCLMQQHPFIADFAHAHTGNLRPFEETTSYLGLLNFLTTQSRGSLWVLLKPSQHRLTPPAKPSWAPVFWKSSHLAFNRPLNTRRHPGAMPS